jgi:hypothetical protein
MEGPFVSEGSGGNVGGGVVGNTLAAMAVKVLVYVVIAIAVLSWLRAVSHGILP